MANLSFWQILEGTPWWVWVLFAYLLKIVIQASRPRVVSLYRLLIGPLFFVALTVHTVTQVPMYIQNAACLVISLFAGISLGFWQISRLSLKVDKQKKLIHLPGSYATLILIIIIFASKFYFAYTQAINPEIVSSWAFALPLLAISGLCTGMFIGRVACYACRFKSLPHQDLA